MCLLFGENFDDIRRNKQTVQQIYNNNYNFARPPDKPRAWAVAGDKKVTLYWDDRAELSYDPFSDPPNDFEGYKIYKATDPGFLDARIVTNSFGEKTFLKPAAQFDIRNEVSGFFPVDFQGLRIYMGDNKGLQHSWTDTDVINGKTYYYAVVSYDRGDPELNFYPSECSRVIVRDVSGEVQTDVNTVAVTPQAPVAGYRPGGPVQEVEHVSGPATGNVWVDVLDPLQVRDDRTYEINFDDTSVPNLIIYDLVDVTTPAQPDTIFKQSTFVRGEDFNPVFDGMRVFAFTDSVEWDGQNTRWLRGESNLQVRVEQLHAFEGRRPGYPSSYEIRFGEPDTTWWFGPRFPVNLSVWDIYEGEKVRFMLEEQNAATRDSSVSAGEFIRILLFEGNVQREVWRVTFLPPTDGSPLVLPQASDVLHVRIKTPFRTGDRYRFTTQAAGVDQTQAVDDLERIAVVPNPYVVAARWEPPRLFATGRGERRLFFIHLPQTCTIRIYTVSGDLVQTLEHDSTLLDGAEPWDLKTKDGLDVAPGVYIFHVEAPGLGEKVGRFAIIK